jgi:hypothetical protein
MMSYTSVLFLITLKNKVGDDEAWFEEWCKAADILRGRAEHAAANNHAVTAASNYLRACFYYQIGDHSRQPKDQIALDVYKQSLDCFAGFIKHITSLGEARESSQGWRHLRVRVQNPPNSRRHRRHSCRNKHCTCDHHGH